MKRLSVGSYQSTALYNRPLFGKIANRSFEYEGPERNPVIAIHGFLGAKLMDSQTGNVVWGQFNGLKSLELFSEEELCNLSHPMGYGQPLCDLNTNVVAGRLLDKIELKVLGMSFHLSAYDHLLNSLKQAGYKLNDKDGASFSSMFVFVYDWRRDLSENAVRLHKFIKAKRKELQETYKKLYGLENYNVQFDIVAHSMGGLLSRYYLRCGGKELTNSSGKINWTGCKYINKLIMLGTPNAGYLDTCTELVNGFQMVPGTVTYPPAVIGTFPSYYQMLPLPETRSLLWRDDPDGEPIDVYDPDVWLRLKWGLADPEQDKVLKFLLPNLKTSAERQKTAEEHLVKCLTRAKQFSEIMKKDDNPSEGIAKFIFLGDAVPTRRTALVDRKTGKIEVTEFEPGDGKVTTSSAVFDRRAGGKWKPFMDSPINWHSIYHLRAAHMGITAGVSFFDSISHCLLAIPSLKQLKAKGPISS